MNKIPYILNSYLQNKLPESLQAMFKLWLVSPKDSKEKDAILKDIYENTIPDYSEEEVERQLRVIHEELALDKIGKKIDYKKPILIAAVSITLLAIVLGKCYLMDNVSLASNKLIYITAEQSKGKFTLPDGSKVFLNSSSQLECPETFDAKERKVKLEGEAYFDVKHGEEPFIVDTRNISVKVLGTAFDVKCYKDRDISQVVLHRGSVMLQTKEEIPQRVKLNVNQKAEFRENSSQITVNDVLSEYYISWTKNKLVFENESLANILVSLQRWYNMDFIIPNDIDLDYRLSFVVRNESVEEVLRNISKVTPLKIAKEKGIFIISQ